MPAMTPRTVRRLVLGFLAGMSAGWASGLLRTPRQAPALSSAASAASLPQHEFAGQAAGGPPTATPAPPYTVADSEDR